MLNSVSFHLIVIITHAPTAISLVSALCDILPSNLTAAILTVDIDIDDNPQQKISQIQQLITDHGAKKILILTDLIGATPYHIARQIILNTTPQQECALVTGISLPMLVKAVNYQTLPLKSWVAHVTDSALEWVIIEFSRNHPL